MGLIFGDFARNLHLKTRRIIGLKSIVRRLIGRQRMEFAGCQFELYPRINSTDMDIWLSGEHPEPKSLQILRDLLKSDVPATYFDIGGNSGTFAVPLANVMAPGSIVTVFEPNPVMAAQLQRNIQLNSTSCEIEVHQVALGREVGKGILSLPTGNMGQGSLRDMSTKRGSFRVDIVPLVNFLPEIVENRPFVIKIDVEGFEDEVLIPFFEASVPSHWPDAILMEIVGSDLWKADLLDTLAKCGYEITWQGEENALFTRPS